MDTITAIKTRKSPNSFNLTPIKDKDLKTIVESGIYAPIFGKIEITVIKDQKLINLINDVALKMMKNSGNDFLEKTASTPNYNALRHCTSFVILSAPNGNDSMGFNMANVSCAAENMILAATSLGIGSRFMMGPIMALTQEPIKSKLSISEDYQPLIAVALGNTDENFSKKIKDTNNIKYI